MILAKRGVTSIYFSCIKRVEDPRIRPIFQLPGYLLFYPHSTPSCPTCFLFLQDGGGDGSTW